MDRTRIEKNKAKMRKSRYYRPAHFMKTRDGKRIRVRGQWIYARKNEDKTVSESDKSASEPNSVNESAGQDVNKPDRMQIFSEVNTEDYSIDVKCPYCGLKTTVKRMITESGCIHFDDYEELYEFSEKNEEDHIAAIRSTFLKAGSKNGGIVKHVSGTLVETDDGFNIMVGDEIIGTMTVSEFLDMMGGTNDE